MTPDATSALALLAVDPTGLGGVVLRGDATALARVVAPLRAHLAQPHRYRRIPAGIEADRLTGGLDLAATLTRGQPVAEPGVLALADEGAVVVPMAERLSVDAIGALVAALDTGEIRVERDGISARHPARIGVVLLDEAEPDEASVARALTDRVACHVAVQPSQGDAVVTWPTPAVLTAARARLPDVTLDAESAHALLAVADAFGVASVRADRFARRVACASAALAGRDAVSGDDLALAGALVLAPRATRLPALDDEAIPPPPPPPSDHEQDDSTKSGEPDGPLADRLVDATRAAIPPELLASLTGAGQRGAGRRGADGALATRGRRIGTRRGAPVRGARLDLLATIRAAVPWQRLRQGDAPRVGLAVRPDDFRIQRRVRPATTTTIVLVDASGSTALHRLNEAKGAVETLLAESYVRRDEVAMVTIGGAGAVIALPPTRALARAKRALQGLRGGGGTPLAAGLACVAALAASVRRGGGTPVVVVLSDGKANLARDGRGDRATAHAEAGAMARRLASDDLAALWLDIGPRPAPVARELATAMGARYLPLPFADARRIAGAAMAAREGGRDGR
ncbi:MAG TPA: magnesium chelatase subunit D [Gemmatimonadales bacterium]|nr:magnesium chelatase subunit D [Gemmatimonadales bacterium]